MEYNGILLYQGSKDPRCFFRYKGGNLGKYRHNMNQNRPPMWQSLIISWSNCAFCLPKKKFGTWNNKVLGGGVEVNIISFNP